VLLAVAATHRHGKVGHLVDGVGLGLDHERAQSAEEVALDQGLELPVRVGPVRNGDLLGLLLAHEGVEGVGLLLGHNLDARATQCDRQGLHT